MIIKKAQFVTSVADIKQTPESSLPIVAFVGRSNVGKSSLINAITNTKNLAKTSSMPGRTRLVNYFLINDAIHFVDLPGYGYAQAGKEHKERWANLLESYLRSNQNIKLILLLVDIRHTPTEQDKQMMRYLFHYNMPFKIVATKADKVPKKQNV